MLCIHNQWLQSEAMTWSSSPPQKTYLSVKAPELKNDKISISVFLAHLAAFVDRCVLLGYFLYLLFLYQPSKLQNTYQLVLHYTFALLCH